MFLAKLCYFDNIYKENSKINLTIITLADGCINLLNTSLKALMCYLLL